MPSGMPVLAMGDCRVPDACRESLLKERVGPYVFAYGGDDFTCLLKCVKVDVCHSHRSAVPFAQAVVEFLGKRVNERFQFVALSPEVSGYFGGLRRNHVGRVVEQDCHPGPKLHESCPVVLRQRSEVVVGMFLACFVYAAQVVEYAHAAGIGEMERRAFGYSLRPGHEPQAQCLFPAVVFQDVLLKV